MKNIFFAKNLQNLRERKKLKQNEVAENIGFSRSQWTNYENEISYPKFLDLIKIANYFDIPETDLIHTDLSENIPTSKYQQIENKNQEELIEIYKKLVSAYQKEIGNLEAENQKLKKELKKELNLRIAAEEKANYK